MTERTDHPVSQPLEPRPRPVICSSSLEEGREPLEKRWKDASEIEEIIIGSSRLDKLPFRIMGASGYEYTLAKINDETREEFHRLDMKRRLEAGAGAAGISKNTKLF
jgi:hypothetical protein